MLLEANPARAGWNARRIAATLGGVGFVVTAAFLTLADGRSLDHLANSDFLWDYYVAGRLLLTGQLHTIYALGSPSVWPPAFSAAAHAIFSGLPVETSYPFVYPPVMVCLIAPFAKLPPRAALLLFQSISVLALAFAARRFATLPGTRCGPLELFFSAFGLLFVGELLVMGQAGLVLGLLPLCAGYVLWQEERPLAAGLAWSVLSIKVQLAFPVVLVVGALVVTRFGRGREGLREPLHIAMGLVLGGAFLAALPLPFMGAQSYRDWLVVLHHFNLNLSDPNGINYAPYLIGSLPELISTARGDLGRLVAGAVSLAAAAATGFWLIRIARGASEAALRRDQMMALAVASLLLIAPYLRLYDSCVLILPAWIALYRLPQGLRGWRIGAGLAIGLFALLDVKFVQIWVAGGG